MVKVVLFLTFLAAEVLSMNMHELNPYIRHAAPSRIHPPCHINRRIILDYELVYVESGEFLLDYADSCYACRAGDLLLLPPDVPHSFHVMTQTLSQPHIHFDLSYDSLSEKLYICFQDRDALPEAHLPLIRENIFPTMTSPFLRIPEKEAFLKDFYAVIHAADKHALETKITFLRMLQMILAQYPADLAVPSPHRSTARQVKAYLDANFRQKITLSALEQLFGYSRFYLEHVFCRDYGESIIRYYNKKRMKAAALLLEDHTVTETARLTGFSSVYAFSRAYRAYFGASPTQHKK